MNSAMTYKSCIFSSVAGSEIYGKGLAKLVAQLSHCVTSLLVRAIGEMDRFLKTNDVMLISSADMFIF